MGTELAVTLVLPLDLLDSLCSGYLLLLGDHRPRRELDVLEF